MKYAIIECINGNYFIRSEGIADLAAAKTQFHGRCQALWNEPSVISAHVMIADDQLDPVEGYKERISHPQTNEEEVE